MQLKENRKINELSLIFAGNFNPVIIQPFWLVNKGLIREVEGENAKVEIIHDEIVKFNLDWLSIKVTKSRLELRSSQEQYFEPLKDIAQGIIKILSETPVYSFGINHIRHYTLDSDKQYYDFGDKIAPLKNWTELAPNPKLLTSEFLLEKNETHAIRLRIQPSDFLRDTKNSIMSNINDHYPVFEEKPKTNNLFLLNTLEQNWFLSFLFANKTEITIQNIINQ